MRSPVYRNTDNPFQILGFRPLELAVLCVAFVGGGEFARAVALNRVWNFVLTLIVALSLYLFRRTFGELFGRRLLRFTSLPKTLAPHLVMNGPRT